jgi:hypothetical protein
MSIRAPNALPGIWGATTITAADFRPGIWTVSEDGRTVRDETTGRVHKNDSDELIRQKACIHATVGIGLNTILSACCVASRTFGLLLCWGCYPCCREGATFTSCLKDVSMEILKCGCTPCICVATQALLCSVVICPSRNMKKYAHTLDLVQFQGECHALPLFALKRSRNSFLEAPLRESFPPPNRFDYPSPDRFD